MRDFAFNFVGLRRRQLGGPSAVAASVFHFTPGFFNFVVPSTGLWKFVAWSAGAPADGTPSNGASGAYGEITKRLQLGDTVNVQVSGGAGNPAATVNTVLTFPGPITATLNDAQAAGGGVTQVGTATGPWDTSLNGSLPTVAGLGSGGGQTAPTNSGGGAPGILPFRGGRGGQFSGGWTPGHTPGGGGALNAPDFARGGEGMVIAFLAGF